MRLRFSFSELLQAGLIKSNLGVLSLCICLCLTSNLKVKRTSETPEVAMRDVLHKIGDKSCCQDLDEGKVTEQ